MKPLDLEEFAADLYRNGNEFGKEILALVDLENEIAPLHSDICADLDHNAPYDIKGNYPKILEWLTDRSQLLDELVGILDKAGYQGDVDDALQSVLRDLETARDELEIAEAELAELKKPPLVYDL